MIHHLTGWDLLLEDDAVCPHCHDSSAHLIISDQADVQTKRATLTEEMNAKSKQALKDTCNARGLSSTGSKPELVQRLVTQTVADEDPQKRHLQYFEQLTCGSSSTAMPVTYWKYRENFNSVDMFNRRLYSLVLPKTGSEVMHMFCGQMHIAMTNVWCMRACHGKKETLPDLAHDIGRALLQL